MPGLLDPTERLLVALSRVRPEPKVGPAAVEGVDLERLAALAGRLGNFNLIARRLLAGASEAVPAGLADRLRRNLDFADLRERIGLADVRRLAAALRRRGEPLLLLKGGAYTRFIYPEPGLRRFLDLDLLLRPAAVPAALELLGALGYAVTSRIAGSIDLRRPIGPGQFGVALELTTDLVHQHDYPYYRADLVLSEERLLARGEERDLDGEPILVLRAEDELLYSVLHFLLHHDLQGIKYHSDLNALLTDPKRPLDLAAAVAVAREARAGEAVGLALLVHEAVFGPGAVPEALLLDLAPSGLRRAALERVLPPLARVPVETTRLPSHPVKVLTAPGVWAPLKLALRWFFPGKRFLMSFYRLGGEEWRSAYHFRYPAAILGKALRWARVRSRIA